MNYTEVKQLAISYADRFDAEVSDRLDDFLRVVESRVNRVLTVDNMALRAYLTTTEDQEYYALPLDFRSMRDIEIRTDFNTNQKITLQYVSPEQLNNISSNGNVAGIYYTIIARQIQIIPKRPANQTLEIVYYRRIIPLNDLNDENWLSTYHPDIYLYGLMVEISSFTKDATAKELWEQRFQLALAELDIEDSSAKWSGTSLITRVG